MPRALAINCYSYIWKRSAYDTVRHLAEAGYRSFELMVNWPHLWPSDMGMSARRRMWKLLDREGLDILSLAPPMLDLNLVSPSPEMRHYTREHYRDVIRLAGEWSTPYVVVVAGKTHPLLTLPDSQRDAWFQDALEYLERAASLEGVKLLLENVPASFLPLASDVRRVVAEFGDSIGVCYDVANAHFVGENVTDGLQLLSPWLELVHLSDTTAEKWEHTVIGTRSVPFTDIARTLDGINYPGHSSLEVISPNPDRDIELSHEHLKQIGWIAKKQT
jgi:sugar phosphate isomerase/epimerase